MFELPSMRRDNDILIADLDSIREFQNLWENWKTCPYSHLPWRCYNPNTDTIYPEPGIMQFNKGK